MRQVFALGCPTVSIRQDEHNFFVALGSRIAQLRKDSLITPVQLAETLGAPQPTVSAYDDGQRRVTESMLPTLTRMLGQAWRN